MARRVLGSLFAFAFTASAAQPDPIPCRNLKSQAQCANDARAGRSVRAPTGGSEPARTPLTSDGAIVIDKVTVFADPLDRPTPEPDKWEMFRRYMTAKPGEFEEFIDGGVRIKCVKEPPACRINCCVRHNEFSITGRNSSLGDF